MVEIKNAQIAREESWINGGMERAKEQQQQEFEESQRVLKAIDELTTDLNKNIEQKISQGWNSFEREMIYLENYSVKNHIEMIKVIEATKINFEKEGYNVDVYLYSKGYREKCGKTGYFSMSW